MRTDRIPGGAYIRERVVSIIYTRIGTIGTCIMDLHWRATVSIICAIAYTTISNNVTAAYYNLQYYSLLYIICILYTGWLKIYFNVHIAHDVLYGYPVQRCVCCVVVYDVKRIKQKISCVLASRRW